MKNNNGIEKFENPFTAFFYFSIFVGIIFLIFFVFIFFNYSASKTKLSNIEKEIGSLENYIEEQNSESQTMKSATDLLEKEAQNTVLWSGFISFINSNLIPKGVEITKYSLGKNENIIVGFIADSFSDAAKAIDNFSDNKLIENSFSNSLAKAIYKDSENVISFELNFGYNPNLKVSLSDILKNKEN